MKSLWFIILSVLLSSPIFAQVQEFEDYMSLFYLNQSDVEDRLGYSCNIYAACMIDLKDYRSPDKEVQHRSTERYIRVVHVGKIERQDTSWAQFHSVSTMPAKIKSNTLKTPDRTLRTRPNGIMEINTIPRGQPGNQRGNLNDWFYSPFEIGYWAPSMYMDGAAAPNKIPNIKCIKTEEDGCTVWWTLMDNRRAVVRIAYDKDVEYLPRSISLLPSPTAIASADFTSGDSEWKKKKFYEFELEWHKLDSEDLYVPKYLRGRTSGLQAGGFANNASIDIHYANWKVGESVDKTLLDEEEFKKLDARTFPFDDLIKAFPDHPPAIVK
jgi:hypothetical protein